ncbi:uncharacterized protein LOC134263393 [Saccostrea cucullata]|uniref:uncharacterized protein LOC134263393 n=1 Tax=Saccostrea cuccullata TaxID=36930 RepID=UPI002ED1C3E2
MLAYPVSQYIPTEELLEKPDFSVTTNPEIEEACPMTSTVDFPVSLVCEKMETDVAQQCTRKKKKTLEGGSDHNDTVAMQEVNESEAVIKAPSKEPLPMLAYPVSQYIPTEELLEKPDISVTTNPEIEEACPMTSTVDFPVSLVCEKMETDVAQQCTRKKKKTLEDGSDHNDTVAMQEVNESEAVIKAPSKEPLPMLAYPVSQYIPTEELLEKPDISVTTNPEIEEACPMTSTVDFPVSLVCEKMETDVAQQCTRKKKKTLEDGSDHNDTVAMQEVNESEAVIKAPSKEPLPMLAYPVSQYIPTEELLEKPDFSVTTNPEIEEACPMTSTVDFPVSLVCEKMETDVAQQCTRKKKKTLEGGR